MYKYPETIPEAARTLDTIDPDWYYKVDRDSIMMGSCQLCILGQAFGGYRKAMSKYFGKRNDPDTFIMVEENDNIFGAYAPSDMWVKEINDRI